MAKKEKAKIEEAKGDMTPMIDCIFLLLIFFMVATKFKVTENKLNMNIPRSSRGGAASNLAPIMINVDDSGTVYLNQGAVSLPTLAAELKSLLAGRPEKERRVTLDGRKTSYGNVMKVIDICNKQDVKDITFKL